MSLYDDASLVMVPSGYKDTKLYSAKPTNGDGDFTFSRGSNLGATRINSEGLIEKGRENLLLQSNTFNTTWTTASTSVGSGQPDKDGGSTAWKLTKNGNAGYIQQSVSTSGVITQSIYAKAGTLDWIRISNSGFSNATTYYDLANGVLGTSLSDVIDASIEDLGNGWYRLIQVINGSGSAIRIFPAIADNDVSGTGGYLYIQDAQLEQGLVATNYIETTTTTEQAGILEDMPRLDYSGGATCPSLLLEPQRSNLFAQSEYYSGSYWSKTLVSFTDNYTTSPEGVQNASRFISAGGTYPQLTKSISGLTIGQTYTASFYVKSDGTTQIEHTSWFTGFAGTTFTATDEWQRISFSITATATTHAFVLFNNSPSAPASSFLLYGLQMEEGSYPTSYIPTYGSSVTRSQDSCSGAGDSSVFNSTQGVLFYEGSSLFNDLTNRFITLSDGTNDNRVLFGYRAISNQVFARIEGNNSASVDLTHIVSDTKDNIKIAISFDNSFNYKMFVNGVLVDSGTGTDSILGLNDLSFTNATGSENLFGKVKQLLYFPTALTDAECIELTTI